MKRRLGVSAVTAAFVFVIFPRVAHAEKPLPARARLYLGPRLGARNDGLDINDQRVPNQDGSTHYALNGAFRYRLLRLLSAEVNASVGVNPSDWSSERGETRTRIDFAAGPVLGGTFQAGRIRNSAFQLDWRVGLTIGYTRAWFEPGPATLIDESYRDGHGWSADLIGGMDFYFGHHGFYVELGLGGSSLSIRHRAALKSNPAVRSDEQLHYWGNTGTVGAGYTFRF